MYFFLKSWHDAWSFPWSSFFTIGHINIIAAFIEIITKATIFKSNLLCAKISAFRILLFHWILETILKMRWVSQQGKVTVLQPAKVRTRLQPTLVPSKPTRHPELIIITHVPFWNTFYITPTTHIIIHFPCFSPFNPRYLEGSGFKRTRLWSTLIMRLPRWLSGKDSTGDVGSIPESGRSPGGGNSSPLQYSCPGNPMNRGAW